jgi:hypothetical protein
MDKTTTRSADLRDIALAQAREFKRHALDREKRLEQLLGVAEGKLTGPSCKRGRMYLEQYEKRRDPLDHDFAALDDLDALGWKAEPSKLAEPNPRPVLESGQHAKFFVELVHWLCCQYRVADNCRIRGDKDEHEFLLHSIEREISWIWERYRRVKQEGLLSAKQLARLKKQCEKQAAMCQDRWHVLKPDRLPAHRRKDDYLASSVERLLMDLFTRIGFNDRQAASYVADLMQNYKLVSPILWRSGANGKDLAQNICVRRSQNKRPISAKRHKPTAHERKIIKSLRSLKKGMAAEDPQERGEVLTPRELNRRLSEFRDAAANGTEGRKGLP